MCHGTFNILISEITAAVSVDGQPGPGCLGPPRPPPYMAGLIIEGRSQTGTKVLDPLGPK